MKRVKNLIKKVGHADSSAFDRTYGPIIRAGVNPWL